MPGGFAIIGTISKKKDIHFEIQLFSFPRKFKDGITFFSTEMTYDRYKSEHTPAFRFEFTILNLYSHIEIHQNNY